MPDQSRVAGAVFLSYASQDAEAAKRICDALRQAGVEVWFDQSELVGGDQWDGKIRGQISSCALFVPVISAATQARLEGYFRREWKQAAARTHDMADEMTFLLPVVIDGTRDAEAKVPAEFKSVQWTKLPGGETPAAFCARVQKLLGGVPSSREAIPRNTDPASQELSPPRKFGPRWLAPAIAGGVIALLALILARPWEKKASPSPTVPTAAADPVASISEARQLVAKAWIQLNKIELGRSELEAAEEFCKQALVRDPNEADAWAASAQVDSWFVYFGLQDTPERREGARAKANRAMQIDPTGYEPRLALAGYLTRAWGNLGVSSGAPEAERQLRELLRERPAEPRALLTLALIQRNTGRLPESYVTFQQVTGNPAFAALAWNELGWAQFIGRDFVAAEASAERSIALHPYWGNLSLKLYCGLVARGDVDEAKRILEQMPPAMLQEDFGAALAQYVYYLRREPTAGLRILNNAPRDWLSAGGRSGPRAGYAGILHEMAGHDAAARTEYAAALKVVEQRLVEKPSSPELLRWKARLLVHLDRRPEAEGLFRSVWEMEGDANPRVEADDLILLDRLDEAVTMLERTGATRSNSTASALLRLDPGLDPLRKNPRFLALLAKLEAVERGESSSAGGPIGEKKGEPDSSPVQPDSKSVAVLAFANLSDDKGNEYFSDGISEELLNVLAKVPGLKVTARTTSFHFKGMNTAIPEIAQQLGVAYVVEGSVRKQGDKVRITAQLIKAADGFHVWSDTFTRDLKDIFAVQDEIAGLIAQQLQLKLGESARVTKVVNPEAYRLLLEGRQFWNLRSEEGFTKAEVAFGKALAIDPQFAEAHAGLGGVCVIRAVYHELDDVPLVADDLPRAVSEGRRALEIDPSSADALAVLAYAEMMRNQLAESDRHFQQALELNPSSALVHCWYALLLNAQGRLDDSLRHAQKAAEVDPLWFINLHMMGEALAFAQRYGQALGILERAEALRTEVFLPTVSERARALLELGRKEEAFTASRQILRSHDVRPRWGSDPIAIHVLWAGGRRQEAEDEVTRLFARYPRESYQRGFILAALGRFDEALPFLQRTPSVMDRHIYWDKMWDPWREDPRFAQLMAQLGRAEEYKVARATLARMQQEQAGK